jgi:hypothetical protein
MAANNTTKKQQQGFKKGQSGNPAGRPKGSLNQTTLACQELLSGQGEALTKKAFELALQGDITALRLCLERIIPQRKEAPVSVNLPLITKRKDFPAFTAALLEAVTNGEINISEAQGLLALAKKHQKGLALDSLFDWELI